ncbi:unnamed protein product (macronuclear) [Paramecium tetraurelia]|uniref:Uncharacterized protein n=1 Tax=Paramecium tetraurelia TaxID=5888 RepID=A0BJI7_PARTE|nr:uncharacterized protein GSPATT00029332001 [Paramecium tetraurelia]CAK58704.1 unnamed protein product [Paramecium tetraurelia]|eukprot:XP_001426102.1 hypothetical protein (macronuclear) [Paramecium tetraurelia strain d4-2]
MNKLFIIETHSPHIICLQEMKGQQVENSVRYTYYYARQNTERSGGIIIGVHKQFYSQNITNYYYPQNNLPYDILILRIVNQIIELVTINAYFHSRQQFQNNMQNFKQILLKPQNKQDNKRLYQYVDTSIMIKPYSIPQYKIQIELYDHKLITFQNLVLLTKLEIEKKLKRIDSEIIYIDKKKAITESFKIQNLHEDIDSFYKHHLKKIINIKRIRLQQINNFIKPSRHRINSESIFRNQKILFQIIEENIIKNKEKRNGDSTIAIKRKLRTGRWPQSIFQLFRAIRKVFKINKITQNQILELQKQIEFDKAISYDCITYQMIKNLNGTFQEISGDPRLLKLTKSQDGQDSFPQTKFIQISQKRTISTTSDTKSPFKLIELRFYQQLWII